MVFNQVARSGDCMIAIAGTCTVRYNGDWINIPDKVAVAFGWSHAGNDVTPGGRRAWELIRGYRCDSGDKSPVFVPHEKSLVLNRDNLKPKDFIGILGGNK